MTLHRIDGLPEREAQRIERKRADAETLAASENPFYARRDAHNFPYGHGRQPCPFGLLHAELPYSDEERTQ